MRDYIRRRVVDIANYIVENKATVRQAARSYNVSKSTVHKDVTDRLPTISKPLSRKVKRILEQNKAERHIRGGEATRRKYLENKTGAGMKVSLKLVERKVEGAEKV
ncbi:MAG TPA: sporulation transcriptional regulator SpoIIID [Firmicutes bacterium]|nr:sporulation transcriptional regulator SpoIIID [Bacillota bacterium]HHY97325.1 sporulation transcriptional regulator SpoIIID [Bacillota bacterium]